MTDPLNRFTGLAQVYAKARPSYPAEAIAYILKTAELTADAHIADVGAGTGISSRLFAELGFSVTALEPNEDMRTKGEEAGTTFGTGNITYADGTGESMGLPDNSQDLVLAAQAFHWFKPDEALQETSRVLKSRGWAALMWNERDESDELTAAYGKTLRLSPETEKIELKRFAAGQPLLRSSLFENAHKKDFPNSQVMDLEHFLQRAFSASYAPKTGELAETIRTNLTNIFHQHQSAGKVEMKYITSIYMAQKP